MDPAASRRPRTRLCLGQGYGGLSAASQRWSQSSTVESRRLLTFLIDHVGRSIKPLVLWSCVPGMRNVSHLLAGHGSRGTSLYGTMLTQILRVRAHLLHCYLEFMISYHYQSPHRTATKCLAARHPCNVISAHLRPELSPLHFLGSSRPGDLPAPEIPKSCSNVLPTNDDARQRSKSLTRYTRPGAMWSNLSNVISSCPYQPCVKSNTCASPDIKQAEPADKTTRSIRDLMSSISFTMESTCPHWHPITPANVRARILAAQSHRLGKARARMRSSAQNSMWAAWASVRSSNWGPTGYWSSSQKNPQWESVTIS